MQFVINQPNFFTIIHNYYCSPVSPVNSFQEMEEAERLAAAAVDDDDEPTHVFVPPMSVPSDIFIEVGCLKKWSMLTRQSECFQKEGI